MTPSFVTGPGGRRLEVLTGQREIHVVADIAWAVDTYVRWSGDDRFLDEGGAELVLQAARFFATRAEETPRGFEIRHVIGPDELHEDVSNSAFTNTMAAWTLRRAAQLADARRAKSKLGEPARWREVADRLVVLHTPDGLLEQHEGFLSPAAAARRARRPRRARLAARPAAVARRQAGRRRHADGAARGRSSRPRSGWATTACTSR